jgi:hypothetical protein
MNLERHLRVIWRHRIIVGVGVLLGTILAFLAAYQVGFGGIERRGSESWSATSLVLVTQEGFPWGRATLPVTTLPDQVSGAGTDQGPRDDRIQFADPTRFANLAVLYSVISYSDRVRSRLPERPTADQIQALPLDPTNSGNSFQPIISLTTTADSASGALKLNTHAFDGLRGLLVSEQKANDIPADERVLLNLLNRPQAATLAAGRSWTSSILAFMLCTIAALAFAHILEGIRISLGERRREVASWDDPELAYDFVAPAAHDEQNHNGVSAPVESGRENDPA